jgi:single-strand DNA-binding protein
VANLNKVMLIGRLTRDPESRTFASGGKVVNFGFAVTNRKKDPQTGEWVDDPCYIDCKAFNRETGRKLADLIEERLRKGSQIFIEGHLVFEQWEDKEGKKQSKLRVVVEDFQFLDPKPEGGVPPRQPRTAASSSSGRTGSGSARPAPAGEEFDEPELGSGPSEEDIPF